MKKVTGLAPFALAILLFSGSAGAADYTASVEPIASWTGPYAAIGGGIRWGDFDIKSKKSKKCEEDEHEYEKTSLFGCHDPCDYEASSKSRCEDPCAPAIKSSEYECDTDLAALDIYTNPFAPKKFSDDDRGFFGTVQIGYNHEIASPLVVGIFASADFGEKLKIHEAEDSGSSMPTADVAFVPFGSDKSWSASIGNIFTVGGRIGIAPSDRVLLYVLAGWSWTKGKASYDQDCGLSLFCSDIHDSTSETLDGLTLGAGGEVRITDNVSLGVEFRHIDFGSIKLNAENDDVLLLSGFGGGAVETKTDVTVQSLRGLLIFHF